MPHIADDYADALNEFLHEYHGATRFYAQEIIEVPGLLVAVLVTFDGVRDDSRAVNANASWREFLARMSRVQPDWTHFDRNLIEELAKQPHKVMGGYEGRTIYFIRGGAHADQWTPAKAYEDGRKLLLATKTVWGPLILNCAMLPKPCLQDTSITGNTNA